MSSNSLKKVKCLAASVASAKPVRIISNAIAVERQIAAGSHKNRGFDHAARVNSKITAPRANKTYRRP